MTVHVQAAVILSGSSVSGDLLLSNARVAGLHVPAVTSCSLFLRGSFDTTSANFVRIKNSAGSGDLTLACGPGSAAFVLTEQVAAFPYLRLESSVTQADTRSLAVVVKV